MYRRMAIYAAAHQDDWQLFMDPAVSRDINDPECKTIIIHTTAGDAGLDQKYWQARESGAIGSLLFRISEHAPVSVVRRTVSIGGRKIASADIARSSLYFLRLPDGGMYGEGFEKYCFQSLSAIRLGKISSITTVDEQNIYSGFKEISDLIESVISRTRKLCMMGTTVPVELNFPEFDVVRSPEDHSDHLNTALLIRALNIYPFAEKRAFVHYNIQHAANDLSGVDLFWKMGMFTVYHQSVLEQHGHSTIGESPEYLVWCRKNMICRQIT